MESTDNTPSSLMEAQAEQWLIRLDADPENPALREQFDRWYNQHPAHAEAFANAELLWQLMGQVTPAELVTPTQSTRPSVRRRWFATAAAVILTTAVGIVSQPYWQPVDLQTAEGERKTFKLDDGSKLVLNTDTRVNTTFTSNDRRLELKQGEAEFDVARDGRPFTVYAGDISVRALGTIFTVGQNGSRAWVNVTESKVKVCQDAHCETLRAGQRLEIQDEQFGAVKTVPASQLSAWKRGLIIAENQPVKTLVSDLDRYYPGKLILLAEPAERRRLNTVLNIKKPEQALQGLARSLKLGIKKVGPITLLY